MWEGAPVHETWSRMLNTLQRHEAQNRGPAGAGRHERAAARAAARVVRMDPPVVLG